MLNKKNPRIKIIPILKGDNPFEGHTVYIVCFGIAKINTNQINNLVLN